MWWPCEIQLAKGQDSKCAWQKRAIAQDLPASPRDTLQAKVPMPVIWEMAISKLLLHVQFRCPTQEGAVMWTSRTPNSSRKASSQTVVLQCPYHCSSLLLSPLYLFNPFLSSSPPTATAASVISPHKQSSSFTSKLPVKELPSTAQLGCQGLRLFTGILKWCYFYHTD